MARNSSSFFPTTAFVIEGSKAPPAAGWTSESTTQYSEFTIKPRISPERLTTRSPDDGENSPKSRLKT